MIEDAKIKIEICCAPRSRGSSVQTFGSLLRANRSFESANSVFSCALLQAKIANLDETNLQFDRPKRMLDFRPDTCFQVFDFIMSGVKVYWPVVDRSGIVRGGIVPSRPRDDFRGKRSGR